MQTEISQLETIPELSTLKILECCDNQSLQTEDISTREEVERSERLEAFRLFLLSGGKFHCVLRCDKEKLEKGEDCGC